MDKTPRRAAIYCRISMDRNHDQLGVDRQERACKTLARRHNWPVVATFIDDDRSAFSGKHRPGYEAMVDAIKAGEVTAIVAWAPARLTRHPRELEDLIDLLEAHRIEVATHIAGDYDLSTSGGRLTARVVGSVARHESEEKSERLRLKMDEIARAGAFHGGRRPFGYDKDGVTIIPAEAALIRQWVTWLLQGVGLRRIETETAEMGVATVGGGRWRFTSIRQVLMSPRIAGLRLHGGEILGEAAWPAIIERAEWDAVQATLGDPKRKHTRHASYPLSGLVYNTAGIKMVGKRINGGNRAYTSSSSGTETTITAEPLERAIEKYVLELTDGKVLPKGAKPQKPTSEVATLEAELDELADLRGDGTITLREWMHARKALLERLVVARAAVPAVRVPAEITGVLGRRGGLRKAWPTMTDEQRRRAIGALLERIVIHPATKRGRVFDLDRIEPVRRH